MFAPEKLEQLLVPYHSRPLSPQQVEHFARYLELLQKWNAKISLTAIRDPEEMVRRHFGESIFCSERLLAQPATTLIDFGSGAGFPGVPIKITAPELAVTLLESQGKKVTFLRELIRSLQLSSITVHSGRAEESHLQADVVTMRAVEKFESALPIAASLVLPGGRLALLIGGAQIEKATSSLKHFHWESPVPMPESRERVLLVGRKGYGG